MSSFRGLKVGGSFIIWFLHHFFERNCDQYDARRPNPSVGFGRL